MARASISTIIRFQYVTRLKFESESDVTCEQFFIALDLYFLSLTAADICTGSFQPLVLWSVIEPGIALFAGGIAVSKPLINALACRIRGGDPTDHPVLGINMEVEERVTEHRTSVDKGRQLPITSSTVLRSSA